ncbi:hypothetical protein [Succinivibrio dextrinosolvens]|uniref:hypothetical protein n=2 Tax=Succinivibrio dextrinosolvens TaxID=83771 RepID=UPI0013E8FE92|nr:hypothetical protein [Succinivibrio dextrinosolvens]
MLSCREASNATLPARLPIGVLVGPRLTCVKVKTPSVVGIPLSLLDNMSLIEPVMLGPNITGYQNFRSITNTGVGGCMINVNSGAFDVKIQKGSSADTVSVLSSTKNTDQLQFSANNSNSVYQDAGFIRPFSLTLNYIIKSN